MSFSVKIGDIKLAMGRLLCRSGVIISDIMNGCEFCNLQDERVLLATPKAYSMFSYWPVSPYHLIILPRRHVEQELLLDLSEVCDIFRLKVILVETIKKIANFRAYNFGVNVGEEAGQTIPHLHYHVIFRRAGDTPDPTGGIRNVIPGRGNYKKQYVDKTEIDVLAWTKRVKDEIIRDPRATALSPSCDRDD